MKEFIQRLTWVDYLAIIAVLRGCYVGYKSGLFPELLRIASYLLSVIAAFRFWEPVAQFLTLNTFLNATTASAVAFFGLLSLVFLLTKLVSLLLLKMLKVGEGGFFLRVIGMLFGAGRWILLLSLSFMLISNSPLMALRADIERRSLIGSEISRVAPMLFDFLSNLSPQLGLPKTAVPAAKTGKTA